MFDWDFNHVTANYTMEYTGHTIGIMSLAELATAALRQLELYLLREI